MLSREEKKRITDYLKEYGELKKRIQNERDHIETLRAIAEDTSVHMSRTPGCGSPGGRGRLENTMLDIVTEEQKSNEKIARIGMLQVEIENLINSVEDAEQQQILRSVYLRGETPYQIAKADYSSKSILYRLLDVALERAYELKFGQIS